VDGRRGGNGKHVVICGLPNKRGNPCTSIEKRKSSLISETIREVRKLHPNLVQGTDPGSVLAGAIGGRSSMETIHQLINRLEFFFFQTRRKR